MLLVFITFKLAEKTNKNKRLNLSRTESSSRIKCCLRSLLTAQQIGFALRATFTNHVLGIALFITDFLFVIKAVKDRKSAHRNNRIHERWDVAHYVVANGLIGGQLTMPPQVYSLKIT